MEKRKRSRVKRKELDAKKEEKDRQERMFQIMSQNPQMAMMQQGGMMPQGMGQGMYNMPPQGYQPGYSGQGQGGSRYQPPPPDQSGNPYAGTGGGRDRS